MYVIYLHFLPAFFFQISVTLFKLLSYCVWNMSPGSAETCMLCSSEYEALSLGNRMMRVDRQWNPEWINCFLMSATYKRLSSEMTDLVNNPPSASEREEMVQRPGNYHLLRPRGDAIIVERRQILTDYCTWGRPVHCGTKPFGAIRSRIQAAMDPWPGTWPPRKGEGLPQGWGSNAACVPSHRRDTTSLQK